MDNFIWDLAEKYNDDPRMSWIDIGFYGNWGEWHTCPIQYPNASGEYEVPPPGSKGTLKFSFFSYTAFVKL